LQIPNVEAKINFKNLGSLNCDFIQLLNVPNDLRKAARGLDEENVV
jgi:hypothetical protein